MAYVLEISARHLSVLRRIAWGYNAGMGDTLNKIIEDWVSQSDSHFICESCKDQTFCPSCFMKNADRKLMSDNHRIIANFDQDRRTQNCAARLFGSAPVFCVRPAWA
jgi:hypothetical protein